MALSVRIRLFLSSYAPLFLILGIRWRDNGWLSAAMVVAGISSAGAGLSVIRATRRITPSDFAITLTEDRGSEVAAYLATCLLPFVALPDPKALDLLAYGLFFLISGLLYVRSEMLQINPTLYLAGWRIFRVDTEGGWSAYLLTKASVPTAETITAVRYADRFLIQHAPREET